MTVNIWVHGLANPKSGYEERKGWLKAFDPDADEGVGRVEVTRDRTKAMSFESSADAVVLWRTQSKVLPLRPDRKPNRPFTAYNIEILRSDLEPLIT